MKSSAGIGSRRMHRVLDYIQDLRSITPRGEPDQEAEAFKFRENIRPKQFVEPAAKPVEGQSAA